jgi:hypothetical protein
MTASITYEVSEYDPSDSSAEVVYTRESDGFIYKRYVNIPHLEDGSIDEDYFKQILDGQLSGVINKLKVGAVTFQDPDADPVGIAST